MSSRFKNGGGASASPGPQAAILFGKDGTEIRSGWTNYHFNVGQPWLSLVMSGPYSNTLNETISWNIWLNAGTYELDHVDFLSTHFGVGRVELDGTTQFTIDQSATGDAKVSYQQNVGSIVATSTGLHTLTYRCLQQAGVHTVDTVFVGVHAFVLRPASAGAQVGKVAFPSLDGAGYVKVSGGYNGNGAGWSLWYPQNQDGGGGGSATGGDGTIFHTIAVPQVMYESQPGVANYWMESRVWLDAGTYALDVQTILGLTQGVGKLTIDGVAVGTPQPAGTVRPYNATSAPGNGNNGGVALVTGEIDHYDACAPIVATNVSPNGTFLPFAESTHNNMLGTIPNALTGIVVATSGWHTCRYTCSGKNSASFNYGLAFQGWFRRTA